MDLPPDRLYGRPWGEKEFIISLHYYFQNKNEPRHHYSEYILKLSRILGRTPSAVVMRMENYASIDPEILNDRTGLVNINFLGKKVFNYWYKKLDALKDCAEFLIRDLESNHLPDLFNSDPIKVPKAFGEYELIDKIGEGGSGSVFSCVNTNSQELFALKILKQDMLNNDDIYKRFLREIYALKSINHPNIIKIHQDNLETEKSFPAFIMDLAKCSLTNFVTELKENNPDLRPLSKVIDSKLIICSVFDAVEFLHESKPRIIHRDINPNNVLLLEDGRWVISDFGLAKFISTAPISTTFQTATQVGWGTMWYTAPEQYMGFKDTNEKTDIYSLGILIWELFSSSGPPLIHSSPGLNPKLKKVFVKATSQKPSNRYRTVGELREAFLGAI